MGGFKQFLRDKGIDVESLEQNTWSAKRGRKRMAEIEAKYGLSQPIAPQVLANTEDLQKKANREERGKQ